MPFIDSSESMRSRAHVSDVKTPALIGVLVLLGLVLMFYGGNLVSAALDASFDLTSSSEITRALPVGSTASSSKTAEIEEENEVYVFVSGAVQNPGVYKLKSASRVGDAVQKAGGFTDGAASNYNNLARLLVDGEQIHIPLQDEVDTAGGGGATPVTQGALAPGGGTQGLVNINTASQSELEGLPGVGPATAQKIISSRESEGPFNTPDEIMRVSGIGDKKYAAIEELICV